MKNVIAEWVYNPKDYFKNEILVENEEYKLKISEGIIELLVYNYINELENIHENYSALISSYFYNKMLEADRIFKIDTSSFKEVNEDGSVAVTIKPKNLILSLSATITADIHVTKRDEFGNIIYDSKKEKELIRNESIKKMQESFAKNIIIKKNLESYKNSLLNPDNELVYLYEIRETASSYFGNGVNARKELKISKSDWSVFGDICNNLPLKQGRHRGTVKESLRDVTKDELAFAKRISKKIINSLIEHFK